MVSANVGGKQRRMITQTGDAWLASGGVWKRAIGQSVRGNCVEVGRSSEISGVFSFNDKLHEWNVRKCEWSSLFVALLNAAGMRAKQIVSHSQWTGMPGVIQKPEFIITPSALLNDPTFFPADLHWAGQACRQNTT